MWSNLSVRDEPRVGHLEKKIERKEKIVKVFVNLISTEAQKNLSLSASCTDGKD